MFLHKLNTLFQLKCASTALRRRGGYSKRNGLSIIEVLTALIVAIIGVFGVLSLIPFAVSQTQLGLDLDNANLYGRNAQEQFESFDYEQPFEEPAFFPADIPGQMPWLIQTRQDYEDAEMRAFVNQRSEPGEPPEPVFEPVLTDFSFYPNRLTDLGMSFNPRIAGSLPVGDAEYYGPQVYHIDPLGVSNGVEGFPFNFLDLSIYPNLPAGFPIPIRSATLADKTSLADQSGSSSVPLPLSDAEVFRMCNDPDRLSFVEVASDATSETTETEPMLQEFIFDEGPNGDGVGPRRVKRFSFSGITWSALASPLKDPLKVRNAPGIGAGSIPSKITGFRMSYLVHKDRSLLLGDEFGRMVYAPVRRLNFAQGRPGAPPGADSNPPGNQNLNFLNRGYVQSVNRIVMFPLGDDADAEDRAELFDDTFRKGDWVMLINRKPEVLYFPPGSSNAGLPFLGGPFYADAQFDLAGTATVAPDEPLAADEQGFNTQIGFFRIISSQNGFNRQSGTHDFNATLTVSGGGFDFFYSDIPGTETFVVHLNNVVNVFEKTFNLE